MQLKIKKSNSTEYNFQFEKSDEDYVCCTWARITLDHDHYCLNAVTDCGDYSYQWCATPKTESFIHLMTRLDKDYLLDKISSRSKFDLEKSKSKTIKNIKEYFDYVGKKDYFARISKEIDGIEDCGENLFFYQCNDICGNFLIPDTFELIDCVKLYPFGAITFCDIFFKYLVPELKKEIERNKGNGKI